MSGLFALAVVVGLLMGALVAVAWRRRARLDAGQRWTARGLAVFFGLFLVALPMAMTGRHTRLVQEPPILVGTLCYLAAFASWQPLASTRRLLQFGMILFVGLWLAAQAIQGLANNFSTLSGPIHGTMIVAAASVTLMANARAGTSRWTETAWFWVAIGLMLVYGTGVLLDPLANRIFEVRADLATGAYVFNQVCSIAGYLVVLQGFAPTRRGPVSAH